jgi:hypothetical protein
MTDPVVVRVRACACPHTPHPDGDTVSLLPTLSLAGGMAAESVLYQAIARFPLADNPTPEDKLRVSLERQAYLMERWLPLFIEHGAVGWNLLDEDGCPVPFSTAAIVADYSLARTVANECDARYSDAVLAPFQTPPDEHSQSGPTDGGTPRPTARTASRRERSSPPASAASTP